MNLEGEEQSRNVEDRRGPGPGPGGRGGPRIDGRDTPPAVSQGPGQPPPAEDRAAAFASTVLHNTEQVWGQVFQASGGTCREPRMVRFDSGSVAQCNAFDARL